MIFDKCARFSRLSDDERASYGARESGGIPLGSVHRSCQEWEAGEGHQSRPFALNR